MLAAAILATGLALRFGPALALSLALTAPGAVTEAGRAWVEAHVVGEQTMLGEAVEARYLPPTVFGIPQSGLRVRYRA